MHHYNGGEVESFKYQQIHKISDNENTKMQKLKT